MKDDGWLFVARQPVLMAPRKKCWAWPVLVRLFFFFFLLLQYPVDGKP